MHTHSDILSDAAKLQSWLYQLMRITIIDHYWRTRVTEVVSDEQPALAQEDENDAVARLTPALKAMVAALPDIYPEVLQLTEYEGLTQKEFAEQLGISVSGRNRVSSGRASCFGTCCSIAVISSWIGATRLSAINRAAPAALRMIAP